MGSRRAHQYLETVIPKKKKEQDFIRKVVFEADVGSLKMYHMLKASSLARNVTGRGPQVG